MRLAVNTYPFLLSSDLDRTFEEISQAGYHTVELLLSPPHFDLLEMRPGTMTKIRKKLEKLNLSVSSVLLPSIDINICSPFPEMRDMTVELYKKAADMAVEVGSEGIVVIAGRRHVLLPPPYDYIFNLAKESVLRITDYTQYTNLAINIETLSSNFLDTVKQTADFIDSIACDRVHMCLDVANVFSTEEIEPAIKLAGQRINLVHVSDTGKGENQHKPIGLGSIDYATVGKALQKIGYDGTIVMEIIDSRGIEGINTSYKALRDQGWTIL